MPFAQYTSSGSGGTPSKWSRSVSDEKEDFDVGQVNRQIENAVTRIRDAGYDISDADGRNWFERATNLPEEQNAFFDALEILGRGGNAVKNVIDKSIIEKEQAPLTAAWRGLSGQDKVSSTEFVDRMEFLPENFRENGVARALLGFGVDLATDPITYIPGAAFAKAGSALGNTVRSVSRAGIGAIERRSPGFAQFRQNVAEPFYERTRDALGRAFVPDYKLGEDLYGRADDTILNAKQATENRISYMSEEAMKNVADTAKAAGGIDTGADVGRIMERDLKQFDENGNEIPRPEREYSSDPAISAAAKNLMRSNQELRQWALDNGVQVGELEGYMKHILSKAERAQRKTVRAMPVDRGNFGTGQPNKKVINERTVTGSVEDVNERVGREMFEPNAYFATAVGQKQLIEYANAASFRRQVLSNSNFAQKYDKGMQVPENAVVIDTNNYKFLPDDLGELAEDIGGEYLVTKSVKAVLDRYKKLTDDEGINSFLQTFDKLQSGWKRMALFSPLYHLRNDVGAKFNNWVGGMSLPNLVKYSGQADKEVYDAVVRGQETKMFREFRQQGLGSTGLSAVDFARRGEEPEDAIRRTIEKRSRLDGTLGGRVSAELSDLRNPLNAFETSRQFGDFVDQTNRYALYKWARETKGMTPEQAARKVREVQFDYSRTTAFEREFMTRLMPFYRWMRNNLPFQVRSFISDPRKYLAIEKIRQNAQNAVGINEENVPEWMKESFAIPVYGEGGSGKFLGLNLPLGDLARATEPGRMAFDAVTPLATLPAEVIMNRNFFYDKPIERFEGQEKQFQVPFGGPEFGVDATLAYILEELTGQVGRGLSSYLERPEDVDQDAKYRMPSLGISSLLKDFDAQQSEYFERRDDLQRLLDLINYIEQQEGVRPRTVREIQAVQ